MKKTLLLLAVPHIAIGCTAVYGAWKAHEIDEYAVTSSYASHLDDAIITLEKEVQKLSQRIDDVELKMIRSSSSSGDEALTKITKVERDLLIHGHPDLERDVKRLRDDLDHLKLEMLFNKQK